MLFAMQCLEGHQTTIYEHHKDDFGCRTVICEVKGCGHSLGPILSVGCGLTYFEEARGRWIENLAGPDGKPVYITSHEQHKREMKKAGVEWCPPRRGHPGCW